MTEFSIQRTVDATCCIFVLGFEDEEPAYEQMFSEYQPKPSIQKILDKAPQQEEEGNEDDFGLLAEVIMKPKTQ